MKNIYNIFIFIFVIIGLSSCYSKKNIVYFYDLIDVDSTTAAITNNIYPRFQKDDRISIKVRSVDKGTSDLFNSGGVIMNSGTTAPSGSEGNNSDVSSTTSTQEGYVVDGDGRITLPYIGKVKAEGLTKNELADEISKQISRFVKDPIVYVDWLNFKYTIIGETGKNVFKLEGDRINIIDAIAKGGDLSFNADMKRVLLIREEDGERKFVRLNFQDSKVLNSPYYYLKQNDLIYVEPKKYKDETAVREITQFTTYARVLTLPLTLVTTVLVLLRR